jgi:hypothetical protein
MSLVAKMYPESTLTRNLGFASFPGLDSLFAREIATTAAPAGDPVEDASGSGTSTSCDWGNGDVDEFANSFGTPTGALQAVK